MSQPEGEPKPQPNSMSFAELIQRLRGGGLSPLADQADNTQPININSTPNIEARMFIDPEGNPVYNFGQKFTPEFQGWEPGQRVRSKFLARTVIGDDGDRVELLVSESVTGDIRYSDRFILENLPQADIEELKKLGLAELDANVQITAAGEYKVSNMFAYPARLDRINAVQQTFDGDFSRLEKGAVLVEGEVANYGSKTPDKEAGGLQIKLPTGQVIDIELWNGYVSFDGGTLEVLDPDYPLPGEKVQVSARYGNPNARYGAEEPDRLFAYWCRSTFLIEPSEQRAKANEERRIHIAEHIDAIKQSELPQDIRERVAYIVNTFQDTSRPLLTKAELKSIRGLVAEKIDDETERPLDLFEEHYVVEDIQKVYGIDITSFSKQEFTEFCMKIARGDLLPYGKGSPDYPWRLLDQLDPGLAEQILRTAVTSLAPTVLGKNLLYKDEAYKPEDLADPDTVTRETKYLFDRSLECLSQHVSYETAQVYLDLAKDMNKDSRFRKDRDDRSEYGEYEIFRAMRRNLIKNTDWNSQTKQVVSIKDKAVAREYTDQLPMLRDLSRKMKQEAWTNNGRLDISEDVDNVISIVEQMDLHFKQQVAPYN